jgi:hypothetical protein
VDAVDKRKVNYLCQETDPCSSAIRPVNRRYAACNTVAIHVTNTSLSVGALPFSVREHHNTKTLFDLSMNEFNSEVSPDCYP